MYDNEGFPFDYTNKTLQEMKAHIITLENDLADFTQRSKSLDGTKSLAENYLQVHINDRDYYRCFDKLAARKHPNLNDLTIKEYVSFYTGYQTNILALTKNFYEQAKLAGQ